MDLLAGYGSGSDGDVSPPRASAPSGPVAHQMDSATRSGILSSLPPPSSANVCDMFWKAKRAFQQTSRVDPRTGLQEMGRLGVLESVLACSLRPRASTLFSASMRTQRPLFSGLPAVPKPKLSAARFGTPIYLADMPADALDESAAPKLAPAKPRPSSLLEALPPPQRSAPLRKPQTLAAHDFLDEDKVPGMDDSAMVLGDAAHALPEDDVAPTPSSYAAYDEAGEEPPYKRHGGPAGPSGEGGLGAVPSDALEMSGVTFKEVRADDMLSMNPTRRAGLHATRTALGSDYETRLRQQAGPDPGKMAKRKHQIGSIFHHAKAQELERLEKNTGRTSHKAESKRKYGW